MKFHGVRRHLQLARNPLVGYAGRNQSKHLTLACSQPPGTLRAIVAMRGIVAGMVAGYILDNQVHRDGNGGAAADCKSPGRPAPAWPALSAAAGATRPP